jgi:hypothetical protein
MKELLDTSSRLKGIKINKKEYSERGQINIFIENADN